MAEVESPSIFEVFAQENLLESLKPALGYVFKILAGRYPSNLSVLYKYTDEVILLLELILENYHLKFHNASFSEFYYGLQRIPSNQNYSKINSKQKIKSLLLLVVIPYIFDKLHKSYDNLLETNRLVDANKRKVSNIFLYSYPYLHAMWKSVSFIWLLLYVLRKANTHSPLLFAAGVYLKISSLDDAISSSSFNNNSPSSKSLFQILQHSIIFISDSLVKLLTQCATTGAFFVQFLEWWYANEDISSTFMSLPVTNPPEKIEHGNCPSDKSVCPICLKTRTNDTVLSVTGFVFCYPCIYRHVEIERNCPVTGYPVTIDHLVRIFNS